MPTAEHSPFQDRDAPVTRGVRLASFCAVENMSAAIHALAEQEADPTALVLLTGVYHDLLRKWAEV